MSQPYVEARHIGDWYYYPESPNRGTFKTFGSSTAALWIAKWLRCRFIETHTLQPVIVGNLRDPYAALTVGKDYLLDLFFAPQDHESIDFLEYAFDECAGAGSALSSLSLACKVTVAATDKYIKLKNAQIVSASIGFTRTGVLGVQCQISALLEGYDTSAPTNWNLISDPGTPILTSLDGGSTPLTIKNLTDNSTETPDLQQLLFQVQNIPSYVPSAVSYTWKDNPIAAVQRAMSFVTPYTDDDLRTLLTGDHYLRATWAIKTGAHSLEFNKGKTDMDILDGTMGVLRKPFRIQLFQSGELS